jgi:hypothetical protein
VTGKVQGSNILEPSCHVCKAPIVIGRRVDSDFKPNPTVLFGVGATTEPILKEVAKTIDIQCKERGLSQDNYFSSDIEGGSDDESGGGLVTWSLDDVYRSGGCRTTNFDEATLVHVDSATPAGFGDAQIVARIESNNLEKKTPINNKQVLDKPKKGIVQDLSSIVPMRPLLATFLELLVKAPNGPLLDSIGGMKRLRAVSKLEDEASQPPHIVVTRSQVAAKVAQWGRASGQLEHFLFHQSLKTCSSNFASMAC